MTSVRPTANSRLLQMRTPIVIIAMVTSFIAAVLPNTTMLAREALVATVSGTWQQVPSSVSPAARYTHGLAFDSHRNVIVLFGGDSTGSSRLNDTWAFDGTTWRQLLTAGSPSGRANIDQSLVFDAKRGKTILFGGLGANDYLNDTWEFDGTTWSLMPAAISPQKRDSHAMSFDSDRGVSVLFGGYSSSGSRLSDTWEYDGAWRQVAVSQTPPGRFHHTMAFDERRQVTVLFGGADASNARLNDTWEYDGTTWRKITPLQSPPARENHGMSYDSARGVIVLFGGETSAGPLNDTWEYDGTTWRQVTVTQSPSARKEMSLVYDSERSTTVHFGGGYWAGGKLTVFGQTWQYKASAVAPPAFKRNVYVLAYDPVLSNGKRLSEDRGWNSHSILTQGTIDFFRQVTNNRLQYNVVQTTIVTDHWPALLDGFRYTEETFLAALRDNRLAHKDAQGHDVMVDYAKIINTVAYDICGKVNRGEIDELWIYNGPLFGFYESTLVGPGAYWYNSPPVPDTTNCKRLLPIMGPSVERSLNEAVHNFGHRTESTMTKVYGSWNQAQSPQHNWERFALNRLKSEGTSSVSGCGDIHHPPNAAADYDYTNQTAVDSTCEDFRDYPNLGDPLATARPTTCTTWGCTELGYYAYWFGQLPSMQGCGPDGYANDWWKYFVEPALALTPKAVCQASPTPTLSINYATGGPGSFFTVTGANFPPNSTGTVKINNTTLTTTITTDAVGGFTFILNTSAATTGRYAVTVTVNPSAGTAFVLDETQPIRPKTGTGNIISVPAGIGMKTIFLPNIRY